MIISVHIPKTAGSSFGRSLQEKYGDGLHKDYADRPVNTGSLTRVTGALSQCLLNAVLPRAVADIECIHGHFLPLKYRFLRVSSPKHFVMWLRDPIARLISHYDYWIQYENMSEAGPLHCRVVEEAWSLEAFCLSRELRNLYSQFLWGFPLENFSFIGITEHFDSDMEEFSGAFLHDDVGRYRENSSSDRSINPGNLDNDFRAQVSDFHAADVAIYRRALQLREQRVRG